jgi:hypothetical protein
VCCPEELAVSSRWWQRFLFDPFDVDDDADMDLYPFTKDIATIVTGL